MYIQRHILPIVKESLNEYPITLITGARQVGKTTLVSYFERENNYTYLSFDDSDLVAEAKKNPKEFIKNHPSPVILDEVQRVPEIFIEIEAVVNAKRKTSGSQSANGMYILTGSEKFGLMKNVSESMSGRVSVIDMPPLSQAEIRSWNENAFQISSDALFGNAENRILSDNDLYESIIRGFYPARWEIDGKPIHNYYSNYVKTYIERDVSKEINLKNRTKFENFLRILASLTGEEFIPDNIAKTIGVDKNTIGDWASILQAGDLITLLSPYYEDSINKRIVKRKKLFFNDTGLACYLLGIESVKNLKLSSFKGRMIETYIHNEIKKSLLNNGIEVQDSMFYYRDNNQNEIDLIINRGGSLNLIECKSGKSFSTNAIKGFSQLKKTKFEIQGGCILCTTEEPYRIESGIYAFPIRSI